jgi:hypothetical protein
MNGRLLNPFFHREARLFGLAEFPAAKDRIASAHQKA